MRIIYFPTPLELWVSEKYKRMKMFKPEDICEEKIAWIYKIFYCKKPIPSNSYENGNFKIITIDSRIVPTLQREQFYHEWCHILRHVGNQNMMPAAFRELQEYDARNFTRYAAIPYHMLDFYDLRDPQLIDQLQNDFKISAELCTERLQKLKSKIKYRPVASSL
ncbi:MAG: ImmA/IrrE family metallo-endopeptidase [Bacillota bacterium]